MAQPEVDPLLQLVEEVDAFSHQLDFFGVVELQPKGARRDRGGERRQRRPLLENDGPKSGTLGEKGGSAADDAAADDDEVGALGR